MSSAPSFGAPGGHIFEVVAQEVKNHVFTAMLAQHVASALRMRLWTLRSRTDCNTPSRLKIDLGQSEYNGFLSYNGYNGFLLFLPVFDMFEDEIGGVRIIIDCQSGWRPSDHMKMSHPVSLGQLRIIISPFWTCIPAKTCQKTILQQNMAWGVVKFGHKNEFSIIWKVVVHFFIR